MPHLPERYKWQSGVLESLGVKQTDRAAKVPLLRKMLVLRSLRQIILIASWVYNQKTSRMAQQEYLAANMRGDYWRWYIRPEKENPGDHN
jgi:hypothetical protein